MSPDNTTMIVSAVVALVGALIMLMLKSQNTRLADIQKGLNLLNGRLGRVEEWKSNHDDLDRERHELLAREAEVLRNDIGLNRESVHKLRNDLMQQILKTP